MKTVGQILRTQREKKKLTLQDIHKFIKIHPKFLTALEEDNISIFSDKIHAKGFLKIYAEFLGLSVPEILAFWRREFEKGFDKKDDVKKIKPFESKKLLITPGLILSTFVAALILIFLGYIFYQYRSYSGAPKLDIYSPKNNELIKIDVVDITGKTERDSVVLINNQRVNLNSDGSFATSIKLHEGLNTLSFLAINKLGKETKTTKTIIYRPAVIESTQSSDSR